jgi:hypothetical protein
MSFEPSITESQLMTAVGDWLTSVLGIMPEDVVHAHENRTPSPNAAYVQMDSILNTRLATNRVDDDSDAGTETQTQPIQVTVQLDCFGVPADDWVRVIATLFRSEVATAFFAPYYGGNFVPLYNSEPRHLPVINGENQYELRWTIDLYFQCNVAVVAPMQFMSTAKIGVINVDATYPQS